MAPCVLAVLGCKVSNVVASVLRAGCYLLAGCWSLGQGQASRPPTTPDCGAYLCASFVGTYVAERVGQSRQRWPARRHIAILRLGGPFIGSVGCPQSPMASKMRRDETRSPEREKHAEGQAQAQAVSPRARLRCATSADACCNTRVLQTSVPPNWPPSTRPQIQLTLTNRQHWHISSSQSGSGSEPWSTYYGQLCERVKELEVVQYRGSQSGQVELGAT